MQHDFLGHGSGCTIALTEMHCCLLWTVFVDQHCEPPFAVTKYKSCTVWSSPLQLITIIILAISFHPKQLKFHAIENLFSQNRFLYYSSGSERIYLEDDRPVSCWEEGDKLFCVAPNLVCTDIYQTGGGGDNISAAGLSPQIRS